MNEEQAMMENLDPKEVEQFKEGFQIARQFIYQPQMSEGLIQDIEARGPNEAVAGMVVKVMQKVQESVGQLSLSVAAALGIALIDDVFDFLEQKGVAQNDPNIQSQALQSAVTQWLSVNNIPPEQLMQELQASGMPPEMMQQLAGGASQGQGGQPAPQQQPMQSGVPAGAEDLVQRV